MKYIITMFLLACLSNHAVAQFSFSQPVISYINNPVTGTGSDYNFKNADFNSDGIQDILLKRGQDTSIHFYAGNGAGQFNYLNSMNLIESVAPNNLVCADFNGDAKADIAFFKNWFGTFLSPDSLVILLGDGTGSFQRRSFYVQPFDLGWVEYTKMHCVDINNDQKPDLVVGSKGYSTPGKISCFFGDGTGSFSSPLITSTYSSGNILIVKDFNSDGFKDIVSTPEIIGIYSFSVLFGGSSGQFVLDSTYSFSNEIFQIVNSDLDNNGQDELVTTFSGNSGVYSILKNDGLGNFNIISTISTGATNSHLICEDFDSDGNIDLGIGPYSGSQIRIYKGYGNNTFNTFPSVVSLSVNYLAAFDVNNDGKKDLIGIERTNLTINVSINTPAVFQHFPRAGGQGGTITIDFYGMMIKPGIHLKLTKSGAPDISVNDSNLHFLKPNEMKAAVNLATAVLGEYDVMITDANGLTTTVNKGFKVENYIAPTIVAKVIAPNIIRTGRTTTFYIQFTNIGNVNAYAVPAFIFVNGNNSVSFRDSFFNFKGVALPKILETRLDNYRGIPGITKAYQPILPEIPASGNVSFPLDLMPNDVGGIHRVEAVPNDPIIPSPDKDDNNDGNIDVPDPTNKCIVDYHKKIVDFVAGNIPYYGDLKDAKDCYKGFQIRKDIFNKMKSTKPADKFDGATDFGDASLACISLFLPGPFGSLGDIAQLEFGIIAGEIKCALDPNKQGDVSVATSRASLDPNDKIGTGIGSGHFITGKSTISYGIRFENKNIATLPAQIVHIVDTLDITKLDLSTFRLDFFQFGKQIISFNPARNLNPYLIDLRPANNIVLKLITSLNLSNGVFDAKFISLDPITMLPTSNPILGFLPPNVNAPEGEGSIYFSVMPHSVLPNQMVIQNNAYIYFDANAAIVTPTWKNIIDKLPPSSKANTLPALTKDTTFTVSWTGSDGESGVNKYDLFYSTDGGAYKSYQTNIKGTSTSFTGKINSTYNFYSVATDSVGNREIKNSVAEATISIISDPAAADNFYIYPNPAHDHIILKLIEGFQPQAVTLTDVLGRRKSIISHTVGNTISIILPKDIIAGVYIVTAISSENRSSKKVIIL